MRSEGRKLDAHLATEDKAYQLHPLPFLERLLKTLPEPGRCAPINNEINTGIS